MGCNQSNATKNKLRGSGSLVFSNNRLYGTRNTKVWLTDGLTGHFMSRGSFVPPVFPPHDDSHCLVESSKVGHRRQYVL